MTNYAKEIIGELREYKVSHESCGSRFSYTPVVCEKAAKLIELLIESKWIDVNGPEVIPDEEVLALNRHGEMMLGWISYDGCGYKCESENELMFDVTHWMPKPALPEEQHDH